jgi:hypothetical protein
LKNISNLSTVPHRVCDFLMRLIGGILFRSFFWSLLTLNLLGLPLFPYFQAFAGLNRGETSSNGLEMTPRHL